MTAKQELLTMWEQADERGKQLIFDILACAVAFGNPFLEEMQELTGRGNKDEIRGLWQSGQPLQKRGAKRNE